MNQTLGVSFFWEDSALKIAIGQFRLKRYFERVFILGSES